MGRLGDRTNLTLGSFIALALIAAVVLAFRTGAVEWFNNPKSFEITLQFIFVAVLGGAVAFIYRQIEVHRAYQQKQNEEERAKAEDQIIKAREERVVRREALQEFYRSFIALHHDCKMVRRTLRAFSATTNDGHRVCEASRFEVLMGELEEVQLRAEALIREVQIRKGLFEPRQKEIELELDGIEKYLRKVTRQYEEGYGDRRNKSGDEELALSEDVKEFTVRGSQATSKNISEYFSRERRCQKLLVELIEAN